MIRFLRHYCSGRKVALFCAESSAILVAGAFGAFVAGGAEARSRIGSWAHWSLGAALLLAAGLQLCLYFGDLYGMPSPSSWSKERMMACVGGGMLAASAAAAVAPTLLLPPGALLGAAGGAALAVLSLRAAWPRLAGEPTRVAVVGNGRRAAYVLETIEKDPSADFRCVGLLTLKAAPEGPQAERMSRFAAERGAQVLVIACDESRGVLPMGELVASRGKGIELFEAGVFVERALRRLPVEILRPSELVFSEGLEMRRWQNVAKRALDLAAALGLLSVALLPLLLVALAIRLDSPGPVLYRQERVGRWGRRFKVLKFRTMREDAEAVSGPVWAQDADPRVTRLGRVLRKSRLDEMPQLLNVLRGEMSFVGPRPERPFFVEQIRKAVPLYGLRELVKPGITGWAQIRYPYGSSIDDAKAKLELDLYYIKNWSLFLDFSVIFHTVRHVLLGRGAR